MNTPITLQARVQDYLAERRRLGFQLKYPELPLMDFARYVDSLDWAGPLTLDIMIDWAQLDKQGRHNPETWARRFKLLHPFIRYLRQFEPTTAMPDESVFGPLPGWQMPHIYREQEIIALPLHPSVTAALLRYRTLRRQQVPERADLPFFVGTRGQRLGKPLSYRQVNRVFTLLRKQLGWINRGAHDAPRVHDLRHTFAVRRVLLWQAQGTDIDQAMLALSTYMGHAKISHTYWYLTAVPELMSVAAGKFEQFAQPKEVDYAD